LAVWPWRQARQQRDPPPERMRTGIGLARPAAVVATGSVGLGLEGAIPLLIGLLLLKLLELHCHGGVQMTATLRRFLAAPGARPHQSLDQVGLALLAILILWTAVIAAHRPSGSGSIRRALG